MRIMALTSSPERQACCCAPRTLDIRPLKNPEKDTLVKREKLPQNQPAGWPRAWSVSWPSALLGLTHQRKWDRPGEGCWGVQGPEQPWPHPRGGVRTPGSDPTAAPQVFWGGVSLFPQCNRPHGAMKWYLPSVTPTPPVKSAERPSRQRACPQGKEGGQGPCRAGWGCGMSGHLYCQSPGLPPPPPRPLAPDDSMPPTLLAGCSHTRAAGRWVSSPLWAPRGKPSLTGQAPGETKHSSPAPAAPSPLRGHSPKPTGPHTHVRAHSAPGLPLYSHRLWPWL